MASRYVLVGIAWYELATQLAIPDFSAGGAYAHWTYGELGKNLPDALWALLKAPWRVFTIGLAPSQKVRTIAGLFAPFLFLSFGSRLLILAVPLLAERFLSVDQSFWSAHFQYSLPIGPVLAMGAADGLRYVLPHVRASLRPRLGLAIPGAMLLSSLLIARLGSSDGALNRITRPSFYRAPAYAAGAAAALRHLPAGAPLATDDYLLPHASQRTNIQLIDRGGVAKADYLLTDLLVQTCCATGNPNYFVYGRVLDDALASMTPVYYAAGWLIASRPPGGERPSNGVLSPLSPRAARRIRADVDGLARTYVNAFRCDPRVPGCFAASRARFEVQDQGLRGAVNAAHAELQGGCAQLASLTLTMTGILARQISEISSAAASPDRGALPHAIGAARADNLKLDVTGRLERLVVLCSPRRFT